MLCGLPFSESRKSSFARSRIISPFLPSTVVNRLTTLTSVENVDSSWPQTKNGAQNRIAAKNLQKQFHWHIESLGSGSANRRRVKATLAFPVPIRYYSPSFHHHHLATPCSP